MRALEMTCCTWVLPLSRWSWSSVWPARASRPPLARGWCPSVTPGHPRLHTNAVGPALYEPKWPALCALSQRRPESLKDRGGDLGRFSHPAVTEVVQPRGSRAEPPCHRHRHRLVLRRIGQQKHQSLRTSRSLDPLPPASADIGNRGAVEIDDAQAHVLVMSRGNGCRE